MERRATSILTILALAMLALTLIAPWAVGQDPDPIAETRRLAEQGDADAQYNLGYRYVTGIGVPQDRAEAVRWLRLAADQGHTQAEDFLGRMPPMGSQRATDNVAETELPATLPPATRQSQRSGNPFRVPSLRTDAEQGDADAQSNLGFWYAYGLGVVKDDAEAARWFRLAADQGRTSARSSISGSCTPTAWAYRKIPPNLSTGSGLQSTSPCWPPIRAMPSHSATSGSCTPTAWAFQRMMLKP